MDTITVVLIGVLLLNLAATVWLIIRSNGRSAEQTERQTETALRLVGADIISKQTESLLTLRNSLDNANRAMSDRLSEGTSALDRRMAVLGEIENRLGQLAKQTQAIEEIGRNIQSLSELLRPPKMRGTVGEMLLENLLAQILPKSMYYLQYKFESGARVDAAVTIGDQLLPLDAKFPLEAYERLRREPESTRLQKEFTKAFRKHVDAIADKYILPRERTTDFALMYIPAEAVYYQLVAQSDDEGLAYALSRRVIPSCPGHLYAFLSSIASMYSSLVLSGASAGELARQMIAGMSELAETTERLERFHDRMDGSVRSLQTAFDQAKKELGKARLQVDRLREPLVPATAGPRSRDIEDSNSP